MKNNYNIINYWEISRMIKTKSGENSGDNVWILSKWYKLGDLKKSYKRFKGATMNNFMMGLVSKSIYKWYQMNGVDEPKQISTIVPVVMKPFSPHIDHVNMENGSSGVTFRLKLKENLEDAICQATKGFNFYFKLPYLIHIMIMLKAFGIFPNALGRYLYNFSWWNLDMTMSNVQGGNSPMYLWDKEITNIYGYLAPFWRWNLNFTYNSYREKVFVQITADRHIQMDPKQLMEIFEGFLEDQIQRD